MCNVAVQDASRRGVIQQKATTERSGIKMGALRALSQTEIMFESPIPENYCCLMRNGCESQADATREGSWAFLGCEGWGSCGVRRAERYGSVKGSKRHADDSPSVPPAIREGFEWRIMREEIYFKIIGKECCMSSETLAGSGDYQEQWRYYLLQLSPSSKTSMNNWP